MSALYTQESLLQIIFITFIVGCGCAWQAGRSMALTWRPLSAVIRAMILLGFAVRFLHFALFQRPQDAPQSCGPPGMATGLAEHVGDQFVTAIVLPAIQESLRFRPHLLSIGARQLCMKMSDQRFFDIGM